MPPGNESLSVGTVQRAGRKRRKPPVGIQPLERFISDSHRFPRHCLPAKMATGEPFLISNVQGGHASPDGGQQQAIGAEGLCDAFAEVDGRFTWCPSLQVPSSVRAGHGDVDTEQEILSGVDCAVCSFSSNRVPTLGRSSWCEGYVRSLASRPVGSRSRRTVSCRRKIGAPGVLERNEVSAKQADVLLPIVVNRIGCQ